MQYFMSKQNFVSGKTIFIEFLKAVFQVEHKKEKRNRSIRQRE